MSRRGLHLDQTEGQADEPAFADIYRAETPWLVRFFRRNLGSAEDANDLAHDTILRFIRIAPATSVATPQAYLRRIASNLLRDRAERGSTRLSDISVPLIEGLDRAGGVDPQQALESRQELGYWEAILRELQPLTLEIFLLSRVDGYSYKEISAHLGIPVWSVKKRMVKAIAHIARNREAERD